MRPTKTLLAALGTALAGIVVFALSRGASSGTGMVLGAVILVIWLIVLGALMLSREEEMR